MATKQSRHSTDLMDAMPTSAMSRLSGSFTPLTVEMRTHIPTPDMCWHLNRAPQTARLWACKQTYPEGLAPIRVNGRLLWPVAGIRRLLGVA